MKQSADRSWSLDLWWNTLVENDLPEDPDTLSCFRASRCSSHRQPVGVAVE